MNRNRKLYKCLSSVMITSQLALPGLAYGSGTEYEGTTQITTADYYLDVDSLAVELEVEEVYVQSGSQVKQGDALLKLTDESYQEAEDYYAAAILRADNNLTNVQMEYDQGILESQYTYEAAKVQADQAEFVKEYQEKELEDTIEDHEEVLADLEERSSELEEEIAAGSFSGSGSGGGAGLGSGTGLSSGTGGGMSGNPGGGASGGSDGEAESGDFPEGDFPGGEVKPPQTEETPGGETLPPQAEAPQTEAPQTEAPQTEAPDLDSEEKEQEISELQKQIQEKETEYQELLDQIKDLGIVIENGGETSAEEGTDAVSQEAEALAGKLETSILGDTDVKTNLENVQKNLGSVPEALLEAVKAVYPNYEEYVNLLNNCILQLN